MPSSATAKTKLVRRFPLRYALGIVCALIFGVAASWWLLLQPANTGLQAGSTRYAVTVADDAAKRKQGLSGRESLADNQGMLFDFHGSAERCMWMKDMNFSIDMIWLDEQKKVVAIEEDISPDTYPRSFCAKAAYVLELDAGQVDEAHIRVGQMLSF